MILNAIVVLMLFPVVAYASGGSISTPDASAITGVLDATRGGTGQSSLTDNALLVGNGTGNVVSVSTLTLTAGGNVGIGSINPTQRFHISSGSLLIDGITTEAFKVGASSFVITNAGIVGIGTGSPNLGKLQISDSANQAASFVIGSNSASQGNLRCGNTAADGTGFIECQAYVSNTADDLLLNRLGGGIGIGVADVTLGLVQIDKGTGVGQLTLDGSTGGCIMLRDTDDAGWTECDALDGTLSCSVDADGICD